MAALYWNRTVIILLLVFIFYFFQGRHDQAWQLLWQQPSQKDIRWTTRMHTKVQGRELLLHSMLWVTDVLIGNLIENVMQWDEKESFLTHTGNKKNPSRQTNTSHKQLWGVIFSLGKTKCRWQRVWDLGLDKFDGGWPKNTPKKPSLQIGTTTTAGHS